MPEIDGVRILEDDPSPVSVVLSPALIVSLNHKARMLSTDLGFAVSLPDIIAWLDRRVDQMIHAQQQAARVPVPDGVPITERLAPVGQRELTPAEIVMCADLVKAGTWINAIKFVRERTSMGLKEAKDYVEKNFTRPTT